MSNDKKIKTTTVEEYTEADQPEVVFVVPQGEKGPSGVWIAADDYHRVKITRLGPMRFDGKEVPKGFLDAVDGIDIDEAYIRENYGGGKYKLEAFDEGSKYIRRTTIDVAGPPIEFQSGKEAVYEAPHSGSSTEAVSITLLRSELEAIRRKLDMAESRKTGFMEGLMEKPEALAALIGAVAPFFQNSRLQSVESKLERILEGKVGNSGQPQFADMLKMIMPYQDAMIDMQQKLMDAKIEGMLGDRNSDNWIGFARELMHGPVGEKLGEMADSFNTMAAKRNEEARAAANAPRPAPVTNEKYQPTPSAKLWFDESFLPELSNAILADVQPDEYAMSVLQEKKIKEPFIDWLFENWNDEEEVPVQVDRLYKTIGIDQIQHVYEAFSHEFVIIWVDKFIRKVIELCEYFDEEEDDDGVATDGVGSLDSVDAPRSVDTTGGELDVPESVPVADTGGAEGDSGGSDEGVPATTETVATEVTEDE